MALAVRPRQARVDATEISPVEKENTRWRSGDLFGELIFVGGNSTPEGKFWYGRRDL